VPPATRAHRPRPDHRVRHWALSGDTSDMKARLTSSHFVGRAGELAELELAAREAATRRPTLVLLGGESGVGKTRLVGELEHRLSQPVTSEGGGRAALVLRGEGVEQGDGELPYAPLLSALRPLVRERHPVLEALAPGSRGQLAALLPGLDDGGRTLDRQDPAGQLRLFEAVLELLDLLSEAEPVVLILEDMHWSDRSTRTFVSFVARSMRQERVMLLLTYRSDELHRRHALRPLLSELERLERARRIELAPFDRDELAEALTDILGDVPTEALVGRLFARSEGNPLYTEELLAAGLDGRGAAPQSLRDAFMVRIERLSADAQRAARVVAVGRRLDEAMIAAVTEIDRDALNAALREAVAEQVLVTGERGLRFRHALLREALYDDLLPGERSELHLALARAFERQPEREHERDVERATTIAGHYAAAGEQPAALRATVEAARAAGRVHAYGEVADLAERALELWPRVPDAERTVELDHVDLLALAARAHGIAGDRTRAEVLLQSALSELDADREARRCAALLARLARVQWSLNRGQEGVATAQRALSMLPAGAAAGGAAGADAGDNDRVLLLAWLARTLFLRGRFRDAVNDGEAALAAATAAGDVHAETEVLNTLGMAQIALGHVDAGVGRLQRAIKMARETGDIDSLTTAHCNLADMLNLAGRTLDALHIAQAGLAATPGHFRRSHDWVTMTVSELSLEAGDWEAARANLGPTGSREVGVLFIFRQLREAELALGEGDEDVAARCLEAAAPLVAVSTEPQWIAAFGSMLGELNRRRRDLAAARTAVEEALDRIELCTDDVMRIARVTAVGARIEADWAQRARDLREPAQMRDALARGRIHLQRLRAAAQAGGPVEHAYLAQGKADLARARARDSAALWAQAAAAWDAVARPYQAAVMRWRQAEAHAGAGDRAAALEPAQAALATARRLGARWLAEEVCGLADRARLELGPGERPEADTAADGAEQAGAKRAGTRQAGAEEAGVGAVGAGEARAGGAELDPFGLTPRERQVLALVAEGATNRQIGAALFMAEKTASVHVSRILSKLGVRSRTQAAAVAHRLHLSRA
jgi:DNA-binding CsgD family transcriptional regulator/tetratricopeptide (TPR) repeat protein